MKKKISDYVAEFLSSHGVEHVFTVTGGGAMHLNDSLGHSEKLKCIYDHHEQACAMGAEGFANKNGKMAAVCVTTGPGGTNTLTGILGAFQDNIPPQKNRLYISPYAHTYFYSSFAPYGTISKKV